MRVCDKCHVPEHTPIEYRHGRTSASLSPISLRHGADYGHYRQYSYEVCQRCFDEIVSIVNRWVADWATPLVPK